MCNFDRISLVNSLLRSFTKKCKHFFVSFTPPNLRFASRELNSRIEIKNHPKKVVLNFNLARPTGFEPAISSVTGRRDGPTSLRAQMFQELSYNTSFLSHKQDYQAAYLGYITTVVAM